jgi:IS30 family transposase
MGYEEVDKADGVRRFAIPHGNGADFIDVETLPNIASARQGAGRAAQRAEQLWRYLTRRHKRRRPRRSRPSQDTIKDRVSIHERPKTVDGRTEGGHWEGDLIICKRTRPVLVLHERKSRVTLAARLAGKTAAETISVILAVFARIEPALRKSITFDNDTAFAQHALLRTMRASVTSLCRNAHHRIPGAAQARGKIKAEAVGGPDYLS